MASIEISSPAPTRGDLKRLGSGSGTISAGITTQSVGNFNLPVMELSDILIISLDAYSPTGSPITNASPISGDNTATISNCPCYYSGGSSHIWVKSEITRSVAGTDAINFNTMDNAASINVRDSTHWGDMDINKTIHINILPLGGDTTFAWAAWILGSDKK